MNLGNNLYQARRKTGYSQEEVAAKIGVSRQTISKWETNETIPDIFQSKKMALMYGIALDDLIAYDAEVEEIQDAIDKFSDEVVNKIDWTSAWGSRYPILNTYPSKVNIPGYASRSTPMLDELRHDCGFSEQDAFLVLKDILYRIWQVRKKK